MPNHRFQLITCRIVETPSESPFYLKITIKVPKDENELIKPAVSGVLYVMNACLQSGTKVKRVVLTSSIVAVTGSNFENKVYNEKDFGESNNAAPYAKSKILAEKAGWDFVKEHSNPFELAVINPGLILGPLLHDSDCSSADVIVKMLRKEYELIFISIFLFSI